MLRRPISDDEMRARIQVHAPETTQNLAELVESSYDLALG